MRNSHAQLWSLRFPVHTDAEGKRGLLTIMQNISLALQSPPPQGFLLPSPTLNLHPGGVRSEGIVPPAPPAGRVLWSTPSKPRSVAASEREALLPGIKQRPLRGWLFGVIIIPLFLEDLDISYMSVPLFPPLLLPVG